MRVVVKERNYKVVTSKSGLPCLWEKGGGYTKTGEATIIAACNGAPKHAIYVKTQGKLCNEEHALIPISIGDYIIEVESKHGEDYVNIQQINGFNGEYVFTTSIMDIPPYLYDAGNAAIQKSHEYHCRVPFYIC